MGIRVEYRGARPSAGLICSNHLSYLDILSYAAVTPCIFVSRSDVRKWPVFGACARWSGTLFIDRQSRVSTEVTTRQMEDALNAGVPILLFPEGTSTDGSSVLRFHPSLLEPAVRQGREIAAAAIGYHVDRGEERDICWYGDAGFLPHLLRTMGRKGVLSEIEFYPGPGVYADRKAAALDLHDKVEAIRSRMRPATR
jgi:1-acyl-sn-glycerol-3-phosphate acyltransferase